MPLWLDHIEVRHHNHVFVFEVVAMEDIAAAMPVEPHDDACRFGGAQVDGVLPPTVERSGPPVPRPKTWKGERWR